MSRPRRRPNHFLRPALAAVLVLAQVVSAFGFPVVQAARVVLAGCPGGACGCSACGRTNGCCCSGQVPRPAPKTGCCAKPVAAGDDPAPAVRWVPGFQARQCRGDSPLGLQVEVPAVPPVTPASPVAAPLVTGTAPAVDAAGPSRVTSPPDPPPKPV
ncbi:MAG: hypothetical protein K2X87_29115 [Gemmataceae bacterium]|nr:hypothetical protein [Gemmataceae bacterium]